MKNNEFHAEWIIAARNGDQNAIAHLYDSAYRDVHIVIRSMLRADEDTVLDLLQDTFIKAFQRLDQLDKPEKYMAWVKQIARNTVLDHLKKSKAILFSELQDDDSIPVEFEDEDLSHLPDIVIDKQETARLLHEILNSLPEVQRAVLSMHYLQEIPIKEIAAVLGRSENTIKVQLRNGRSNLEKKIRDLEKKEDIKLYSLAPLPLLLLLLRNMESYPVQPDAAVLGNILQSNTAATGSASTAATAKAAGAVNTAGSAAAKGILGKIVAGIAAVTLCGGAVGMYLSQSQQPTAVATEPTCQTLENTEPIQTETQPELYDYEMLVEEYRSFIEGEIPIDQASIDLSQSALNITPAGCSVDGEGFFVYRRDVRYSIAEYDINDDGIKELIIFEVYQDTEDDLDGPIIDIFTFRNGQPVWLIAGAQRCQITLCENGIIHERGSGGAEAISNWFYEIIDGALVVIESAEMDWGTFYVNGNECSEELYWHTVDQYWPIMDPAFELITTIVK